MNPSRPSSLLVFPPVLAADDVLNDPEEVAWLWDGYLARGNVTLLSSQWKSGKTTLLSILLSRLDSGGVLGGLGVSAGRALVISEEPRLPWRQRLLKQPFRSASLWLQPFRGKPTSAEWQGLLDATLELHEKTPLDLVVFDTLTTLLPGRDEANAGVVMESLLPLKRLTQRGLAVLLMHHPPKGASLPGQAARGSGAFPSFADILLEMSFYIRGDVSDRRRRLLAFSRYEATPPQLVLELNAEGTDYVVHGDFAQDEFAQNWSLLKMVLEDADAKLTRRQLVVTWPKDYARPADATLYRWLTRAVSIGLVNQEGTGRCADPFRYWLPSREEAWKADPGYELSRMIEEANRRALEDLTPRQRRRLEGKRRASG